MKSKKIFAFLVMLVICMNFFGMSFGVYIPVKGDPSKYTDIANHWAYDAICNVIQKGYFKGITNDKFEPETDMSRAMIVTVLWRLTGDELRTTKVVDGVTKSYPRYVNMFWDMKDDEWFTDYVAWANKNDIIDGYSKREFRPNESITREQLAVILHNYLKNYKLVRSFDLMKVNEPVKFTDEANISEWAREKVSTMQQIGLLEGRSDGSFDPKATVTRAEIATVIERLLKKI